MVYPEVGREGELVEDVSFLVLDEKKNAER